MVCTGSHTITLVDMDAGSFLDTGTADSNETAPVDAPDTVYADQKPAISIDKRPMAMMMVALSHLVVQ
jgi:hypothetical protein